MASDHGHGSGPGPIDDAIFRPNQKPRKNHPTNSAGSDSAGSNSGGPDSPGPLDDERLDRQPRIQVGVVADDRVARIRQELGVGQPWIRGGGGLVQTVLVERLRVALVTELRRRPVLADRLVPKDLQHDVVRCVLDLER